MKQIIASHIFHIFDEVQIARPGEIALKHELLSFLSQTLTTSAERTYLKQKLRFGLRGSPCRGRAFGIFYWGLESEYWTIRRETRTL